MKKPMPELLKTIENGQSIDEYLRIRGSRHSVYRFYNKVPRIATNIIENNVLVLDDGKEWNDTIDAENFSKIRNGKKYYGMCFSFSKNESVAMWMLYGGLFDEGAM